MFGISALGKAFLDCISNIVNYEKTKVENQETLTLVGDKKDLKKATNLAELIIELSSKYQTLMTRRDQRKFKALVKQFNKVD